MGEEGVEVVAGEIDIDIILFLWRCLLTVLQNTFAGGSQPRNVAFFVPCQDLYPLGGGISYGH